MRHPAFRFAVLIVCFGASAEAASPLPTGSAPPALPFPHFPDRLHAFVWRNWTLVGPERMADVLGTGVENVEAIAESMGLPRRTERRETGGERPERRSYITVLRRNWHLLPYEQLLELLDMSAEDLAYSLREDDFLFIKLGRLKPKCEPLKYTPPDETAKQRAAEIKRIVRETFGDELARPAEPRFHFVEQLSDVRPRPTESGTRGTPRFGLRFIYSYFGMYGDPLMDSRLDPYPDGLLQRLSELGVTGVWIHTTLRHLAPSDTFPEFGEGHETRLGNLRRLVQRAKRYGIGVYLYMNEPRAMPAAFFKKHPHMQGVREGDHIAVCTSVPEVRQWLTEALAHVFGNVPDLAGVFTITASENLTNCASHRRFKDCPRCRNRTAAAIIAEVNAAIEAGVHRANPGARVIVWDWGWSNAWAEEIIPNLPKSVWFMSVSEWSKPISRGGVESVVGEYSISAVGPGPRATRHWALAKKAGLRTVAKVQMNNSWELSAVPYLPVMDLTAEHCGNLAATGVDGIMLGWTLGGYPSPNLEIARRFSEIPTPAKEDVLNDVARERFGPAGAAHARKAWKAFSDAFREYPFNGGVVYRCPVQFGPSNLLYPKPTHYKATMIGFPYDDVDGWRGPYPADVFAGQFARVAAGWRDGLTELEQATAEAPADRIADARAELRIARAAVLHFQSVANQVRFTMARNALLAPDNKLAPAERKAKIEDIRQIVRDEIEIARRLFTLARSDSRIGFEASNQYYYLPIDLVEKVINCRHLLDHALADLAGQ